MSINKYYQLNYVKKKKTKNKGTGEKRLEGHIKIMLKVLWVVDCECGNSMYFFLVLPILKISTLN